MAISRPARADDDDVAGKQIKRTIWSGVLAGVGLVAFADETVFHQLLHWHHFYDKSTLAVGLVSDGLFHAGGFIAMVAGPPRATYGPHWVNESDSSSRPPSEAYLAHDMRRCRQGWGHERFDGVCLRGSISVAAFLNARCRSSRLQKS